MPIRFVGKEKSHRGREDKPFHFETPDFVVAATGSFLPPPPTEDIDKDKVIERPNPETK
jgi:hypothetical protein